MRSVPAAAAAQLAPAAGAQREGERSRRQLPKTQGCLEGTCNLKADKTWNLPSISSEKALKSKYDEKGSSLQREMERVTPDSVKISSG